MATEAQALLEKLDRITEVEAAQKEPLPRPFGPYLLLASLAKGGMGEVFLARSGAVAGFEKHCVVKTLRPHLTDDREYVARFIDEARVVVQLGHKNVCHVFDVGMVGERYYLAMELIAGKDLRTLADVTLTGSAAPDSEVAALPGRSFDPAMAIHIVSEVLEALDYAHRFVDVMGNPLHLVHRDISPQNVMLSFEGEVKLIDFGLAASTVKMEQTSPNVVMGKLAYMAPEQIRGEKLDGRADLFATAVMLTELCTGERYYAGKTPYEIWSIASTGTFRPRRFNTIEAGLRKILDAALAPDCASRPATCVILREQLMQWRQQQSLFADGPKLRGMMQQLFSPDIRSHRELLAGVTSASHLRATVPSAPVKEPTRSFARTSQPEGDPSAPHPASSSSPSPSSSSSSLSSSSSSAARLVTPTAHTEHTGALVRDLRTGNRPTQWLLAAAALLVCVAVIVLAWDSSDHTVTVAPQVAPPDAPQVAQQAGPQVAVPVPDALATTVPTTPTPPTPSIANPTNPTNAGQKATDPKKPTTPNKPLDKPIDKSKVVARRAWGDLRPTEKVESLGKSCKLTCVDDLERRVGTWGRGTTASMRQFTTDLEACHDACVK